MEVEPTVLVALAEKLEERTFAAGTTLVSAGARSEGIHLIRVGRVAVAQHRGSERVAVATLGPRDSFGELSALNATTATANCVAETAVSTFFIPAEVLSHALHEQPRLAIGVIRMLSQRLTETTLKLGAPAVPPVPATAAAAR